ncbi:ABC transporter substrate-binding protein [Proteiniclasticum sp. SCR006]|uniref:ABC transporter substrate-binding protein n=1 Tax=Proteiniclasticum aestuarii TaxID=2817862 RepID=A0A939HCQ2_9CLOT|nr:ABC transporter substrate-binding protein [Proteiniclasticum aestuarii]MBO1265145.1 ABC transporter substrate-binding protein [Proteiniclasticum aestuarii]
MKKVVSLLLASMMMLGVLAGCSSNEDPAETPETPGAETPGETPEEPAEGGVIYSNGGPIEFFEHPWLNPGSFLYNKTLFDHLIVADENLNPEEGQLAADYNISEDGMNLEFNLKEDLFWHDGEAITADDVKESIEYALKISGLNAVFASTFNAIKGAEEFVAGTADEIAGIVVDGNNIKIEFAKLAPDALLTFTQFAPLPMKHFEGEDPLNFQQSAFWQSPVGSGPFMVEEVKLNEYTTLKPFDKYHAGAPSFSIYLTPSPGDSDPNLVTNAQAGMVDYAFTKSVEAANSLKEVEGLNVTQVDIRYTRLFYPNKFPKADGTPSPLADAKVRQAIAYAIDMAAIAENLFKGAAVPANSLSPNEATKATGLNDYDYNPEKAKELLAEANWDEDYELDVVYYYTDQQTVDFMAAIQSYLKDVGIKMNFRLLEGDLGSLLWTPPADPVNGPSAVEWDLAYAANAALSLHEYYDRYQTGSSSNSHTPSDPKLDELIEATNSTFDTDEIVAAFQELQKYENETLFTIPLYYQPTFVIESDKIVKGAPAYGNPQFNYNWEIQNWEVKAD